MRKLVWTLLVLAILAVLLDRGAAYTAEQVVARELRVSQGLTEQPRVSIHGFPFLTQFADGRYPRVSATATDIRAGRSATALRLRSVRVDFEDVTASRDFDTFHARRATAHTTVGYAELGRVLNATVRYAGNGRISAKRSFTVLGTTARPSITMRPGIAAGMLSFTGSSLDGVGDQPPEVVAALRGALDTRVPVAGLPFGIRVRSLTAEPDGLHLTLTVRDLSYRP